jgi:hypothetical protein
MPASPRAGIVTLVAAGFYNRKELKATLDLESTIWSRRLLAIAWSRIETDEAL